MKEAGLGIVGDSVEDGFGVAGAGALEAGEVQSGFDVS